VDLKLYYKLIAAKTAMKISLVYASVYNIFINHYGRINIIRKFNCKKLYIGAINTLTYSFITPI